MIPPNSPDLEKERRSRRLPARPKGAGPDKFDGTRLHSDEFISEVLSQLPDPFDLQRDQQILARYGLDPERLTDRMGGNP
jgi:hypothetical protein